MSKKSELLCHFKIETLNKMILFGYVRWIFGDFGCQMYAGLGFILGLASIFSAQLLVFDFYMHTIKCDYSGKNLLVRIHSIYFVSHNLSG